MNMSPEALYQLAKKMPVSALVGIVQGQPGTVPPSIALMVLNERNQQKIANAGMQAQGELQKPNVATQVAQQAVLPEAQGVGMLAANNMGIPDDGIVGMAEGGGVKHFQVGGGTTLVESGEESPYFSPYTSMRMRKIQMRNRAEQQLIGLGPYDPNAPLEEPPVLNPETGERMVSPVVPVVPVVPGTTRTAPGTTRTAPGTTRTAPDTTRTAPGTARTRTAATPYTGPVAATPEALDFGTEKPVADASTARAAITAPAQAQGLPDILQPRENKYVNAMSEALAKLNRSPDEKDQRLGLLALNAAQALLAPGQTASGARGAALGKVAELTQKYTDSDKQTEKDRIGMQLGILGAQAGLAQGDTRLAIQYAEVAARDAAYKAEADAKQRGLSLEERKIEAEKAYRTAYIGTLQEANRVREKTAMRQIAAQENTATRIANQQTNAEAERNQRALIVSLQEINKAIKESMPGQKKKDLEAQRDSLLRQLQKLPSLVSTVNPDYLSALPSSADLFSLPLFEEGV